MRFPVYSINMTIRDYNNLLIRGGTNHILFDFSLKLRREPLNHNSGAYNRISYNQWIETDVHCHGLKFSSPANLLKEASPAV